MKVSSYQDTEPVQELPGVVKREVINANDGAPNFCMRRMIKEYTEQLYVPAARNAGAIDAEWEEAWKALPRP